MKKKILIAAALCFVSAPSPALAKGVCSGSKAPSWVFFGWLPRAC